MFTRILPLSTLVLVILFSACSEVVPPENSPFCKLGAPTASCTYNVTEHSVRIFATEPAMPEETPIQLLITGAKTLGIERAYLTGENMYMGSIPVNFTTNEQGDFEAQIRLGVCAEPNMIWRLNIEWENAALPAFSVVFAAEPFKS
ncbi:MAG: hypothetical protein HLUCCO02_03005 [Idiomarinaceae bacterium HL-53]|nr:MAG: hypothetical protein HLUCCO02_03005 [Idiomarinaceae bacterium HL-53]CUS48990.1 hypothetical protein Ga0003345_1971 [Idiomarinaceae bacterium HL-53]